MFVIFIISFSAVNLKGRDQVALYGGMILLPIYLQTIRGFSPLAAASLVVVMTNQSTNYVLNLGMAVTTDAAKLATIHGINSAFLVSAIISALALALSFFFKKPEPEESKLVKKILLLE